MLTGVTYWDDSGATRSRPERDVIVRSPRSFIDRGARRTGWRPNQSGILARLIRRLRPDVVHAMEFQHAGYLTRDAYELLRDDEKPPLIVSNYGSDISLFGLFPEYQPRIRALLAAADVYHCECARDVALAREFDFAGMVGAGDPHGRRLGSRRRGDSPSPWSNLCSPHDRAQGSGRLGGTRGGGAGGAAWLWRPAAGLHPGAVPGLPRFPASHFPAHGGNRVDREISRRRGGPVPHQEVLALHGRSRISIGLSISDGISTSLLEAMIMGSFPIQSHTACADEWIEDGVSGFIVPPEDPEPVTAAIRRALEDDDLVNSAASVNAEIAQEDLEFNRLRGKAVTMYEQAAAMRRDRGASRGARGLADLDGLGADHDVMRVLILGGSGMIGHRLWLACRERFETTVVLRGALAGQSWASFFDPRCIVEGIDLADDEKMQAMLRHARPDAVVNAAGLVKQRPTGQDAIAAITLNALLPHRLAQVCQRGGIRLIHLSTDCVFSGRDGGYRESDAPDPVDTYGRAKLLGEVTGPGQLTIRKSAIGRELTAQRGLLEWFLANSNGRVHGYSRAIFSGLTTTALAATIAVVLEQHPSLEGLWHVAGPAISKYDLLLALRDGLGVTVEIEPDNTAVIDRSLDDSHFRAVTGIPQPSWESMIAALAADPLRYDTLRGTPC